MRCITINGKSSGERSNSLCSVGMREIGPRASKLNTSVAGCGAALCLSRSASLDPSDMYCNCSRRGGGMFCGSAWSECLVKTRFLTFSLTTRSSSLVFVCCHTLLSSFASQARVMCEVSLAWGCTNVSHYKAWSILVRRHSQVF
jgi:hypothetical protein